ncbi:hypothetical protein DMP06_07540 [Slackia equolifaciens]|uniref:Glycosyltransferase 2-like domain-containing protein n=1 Tax=Slackia equolifaciens TaxID=498718 RepID=A0A3N0AY12_9ACTN|nr:CDP-glycerol glycerophosphotransferase family protein [Slackia equolifaciens]RNL39464.1 hypothetical protein DMP06_07540 [Slackia equolifaciens]
MPANNFLFSVILPIYNMERYLEDALESIVSQTIGFKQNIQAILVDDGSTDDSLGICNRFAAEYPDNVIVIHQKNAGVGAARNAGMEASSGSYITFLDPDDKWDADAFNQMHNFFLDNPNVRIAAARIKHFGRWNDYHALDYKFSKTRIINIFAEWDKPQLSATTVFFARSILSGQAFGKIKVAEDFLLVSSLIAKEGIYGVVRESLYLYRKRFDSDSAIDTSKYNMSFYFDTVRECYYSLFGISRKRYGYVIPYIQNAVMYDLQWRISAPSDNYLKVSEKNEYRQLIVGLLRSIDNKVICRQRNINAHLKLYSLAMKYGLSFFDAQSRLLRLGDGKYASVYVLDDGDGAKLSDATLKIEFISMDDKQVHFEGLLNTVLPVSDLELKIVIGKTSVPAELFTRSDISFSSYFEDTFSYAIGFKGSVPSERNGFIDFRLSYRGVSKKMKIGYGIFSKLSKCIPSYYCYSNNKILISRAKHRIQLLASPTKKTVLKREFIFDLNTVKRHGAKGLKIALKRIPEVLSRLYGKPAKRVWLISDRLDKAGDNGEAFFNYVAKNAPKDVSPYFVISSNSADCQKLKRYGKVVDPFSHKYGKLFLRSEYVVSSSFDAHVYRHFGKYEDYYKNLYQFKYVFLQHGVIKDDMSFALNRYRRNIYLFVTSSEREYDSILSCDYYYSRANVVLSGLPRHDLLRSCKVANNPRKNKIIIMPTWRNSLVDGFDSKTQSAIISESKFMQSNYYTTYNSLLGSDELRRLIAEYNISVDFVIHPGFSSMSYLFESIQDVNVLSSCDYREEFISASLMITDYSSVAFDFAILRKPVLYYQFDSSEVLDGGHIYSRGYFSYENDGFGPVCESEDELLKSIREYAENNFELTGKYSKRVDSFFFSPEKNESSSQIIMNRMLNIDSESIKDGANVDDAF